MKEKFEKAFGTAIETAIGKITQAKEQAREAMKLLETLETESLSKALDFVKNKTNDEKLAQQLRKVGLATAAQVNSLEARVKQLEAELATSQAADPETTRPKKKTAKKADSATPSGAV